MIYYGTVIHVYVYYWTEISLQMELKVCYKHHNSIINAHWEDLKTCFCVVLLIVVVHHTAREDAT